MAAPRTALPGQRYERLTVIREAERSTDGKRRVLCRCDCGVEKLVAATSLSAGSTKSCGCLSRELASARMAARRKTPAPETTPLRANIAQVVDVIREDGIRLYVVECPFCEQFHRHAVPDDVLPSAELSRSAKCGGKKSLGRSYQLVVPDEEPEAA